MAKNQQTRINWPATARVIERILFGALLGMLAGALVARFLLLAYGMVGIILGALLVIGADIPSTSIGNIAMVDGMAAQR